MNLMMLLEMAAQGMGDREAVVCDGRRYTSAQLYRAAGRLSRMIRESGVKHLSVLDVSSPAVPIGLFSAAWAGVPFVPLNYRLTAAEVDALIERVKPVLIVAGDDRVAGLQGRDGVRVVSRNDFLGACDEDGEPPDPDWSMEPEDIAILLFTSGTTGDAQGRGAPPQAPGLLHPGLGRVHGRRRDGRRARLRAALPHRRHGGGALLDLRGAPHRAAPGLRAGHVARAGGEGARDQRLRRADHARAHRRRDGGEGRAARRARCAPSPTAAARCRCP